MLYLIFLKQKPEKGLYKIGGGGNIIQDTNIDIKVQIQNKIGFHIRTMM